MKTYVFIWAISLICWPIAGKAYNSSEERLPKGIVSPQQQDRPDASSSDTTADDFFSKGMERIYSGIRADSQEDYDAQVSARTWSAKYGSKPTNILTGTERRKATRWFGELVGGIPRWVVKTGDSILNAMQKIVEMSGGSSVQIQSRRYKNKEFLAMYNDTILSRPELEWNAPSIMALVGENIPNLILVTIVVAWIVRRKRRLKNSSEKLANP